MLSCGRCQRLVPNRNVLPLIVVAFCQIAAFSSPSTAGGNQPDTSGILRIGGYKIIPQDSSGELRGPETLPGVETDVLETTSLALSYEHRISELFSIEVAGGLPPQFEFSGAGTFSFVGIVGKARSVSPTVFLNVHPFGHDLQLRPHIGVGFTYTNFIDEKTTPALDVLLGPSNLELKSFVAPVVKLGADIDVGQSWILSFSASYAFASSTATITSGGITREIDVRLDPIVLFVGVGYEF